jgi:hypothetical protein
MTDRLDHYHEEDIVKNLIPTFASLFTRRHGVDKGKVLLNDDNIVIEWKYETTYPEDTGDHAESCECDYCVPPMEPDDSE